MRTIERHLQQCINRIENWASHNGFKFSKSKTQCVHFCQLRKVHNDPELYLYCSFIPVVEDFKFLEEVIQLYEVNQRLSGPLVYGLHHF